MNNYGMPYMGSKSGIVKSIALNLPSADNFYDLFGGGFAVSHYMAKHRSHKYKHIHYNEIKSDIADLVKKAIAGEFSYENFKPEWICREKFFERKENDAYVRCLWSFGNDQKTYLFSKEIEPYKKAMHQAVIFDEFSDLAANTLGFKAWPKNLKNSYDRRIFLSQKIEKYRVTKVPDFLLTFLNKDQLQQLQQLPQLQRLERLQQLESLQRLERLQQLQRLNSPLYFSSSDYRKVTIKENSVVYCDIPYKNTVGYLNDFNHDEFYDWAVTSKFPVYISEYDIQDPRLKLIYSVDKRSMLSASKNVGDKQENLYWNGVNL